MEEITLSKDKSLVNLANSILKFFGCKTYHDSISEVDELLKKSNKKKICVFLFDAFGKVILEKYKDDASFMYDHRFLKINSVFPPTTVACTTSINTGKYPIETGYLGWTQYFKEVDKFVDVFPSTYKDESSLEKTTKKLNINIQDTILKIRYIFNDINEKYNKEVAKSLMSFNYMKKNISLYDANENWAKDVEKSISENLYTYAYNIFPDSMMHEKGVDNIDVKKVIIQLNSIVKRLVNKHKDTLFLALSDHGMLDVKQININDIPHFVDTLTRPIIAIEGRFASFFVKNKEEFLKVYYSNNILNKHFLLLSKKEVLEKSYFGYSEYLNPIALETIGDYLLISLDEYSLVDNFTSSVKFKAAHAGLTKEEREIYLMAFNDK